MYNPFNHTCYSVGRESSFELDVTTSWRGNGKKTCLLARALRALHPVDTIRFLYNRSNGGRGTLLVLFFPPFCPRYRVLPSTISIGKSVRANRDNVVQRRVIVRSRMRNWNARNRYAWNRGNVVSFKYIGRDIERLENVFRVCIPSVEQY